MQKPNWGFGEHETHAPDHQNKEASPIVCLWYQQNSKLICKWTYIKNSKYSKRMVPLPKT